MYTCAHCRKQACNGDDRAAAPRDCPGRDPASTEVLPRYLEDEQTRTIARNAALVESHGYCRSTRVEEIMDFARRCGFQHIGIAFCVGLQREAAVFARVLRANGFTVDSVACKNGSIPKESLGIADADKLSPGEFEPMCNPIGQASLLEKAGTQLNVILGLCVGHDTLFLRSSAAPTTVLAAKDRVLGHNPVAALYLAESYYREKLFGAAGDAAAGSRD